MNGTPIGFTLGVLLLAAASPARAIDIPLTVTNREAVARPSAPVTTGVPFAPGVITNTNLLRLLRNGTEIPLQAMATARWPDGSARWVLLDFQVDLPASGSAGVTLQTGTAPAAIAGITVDDAPATLSVDSSAATFTFTKSQFSVLGAAFQVQRSGTTYQATPATWTIEQNGPMTVVVRVDGVWRAGGAALVNDLNRFRARLVFYRGRTDVRVFLTFRNNNSFGFDTGGGGAPQVPDLLLDAASFGATTLLAAGGPSAPYVFGSSVEKTWEAVVPQSGVPAIVRTRFTAAGALAAGDTPPPPLAAAAPAYYAASGAWGRVAPPVTGLSADRQADFDLFERIQRAKVDSSVVQNPPGLTGITAWGHLSSDIDSWNDYGDLRWAGNEGPLSSNHYDWVYGMYLQYMRSGTLAFADAARVMARHEIDFDVYHTGADSPAFNYQKDWESRQSHNNPGNSFGGGRPSHTWSQGYALQWLVSGDPRGKDAFDEIQEGVRQYVYESFNGEGHITSTEIRIQGWLVENLVNLWRVNPTALIPTTSYGSKTIPEAIKDVLQGVFELEAAAGSHGYVPDWDNPYLRSTLSHTYILEPMLKAHAEVFAGRDPAYAATLLALLRRMTEWLMSTTYGGDTDGAGRYRPWQIPYRVDTRLATQGGGEVPYLLMVANAAGYFYTETGETTFRDYARRAFQEYVRYAGAIDPAANGGYGDPAARTPASYNSHIYMGTESKIHGWSSRYGQYVLASEAPAPTAPVVTTHPSDQTVASGTVVSFTAVATGVPAATVQWQVSANGGATWTDIGGATSTTYSFQTAPADSGRRFRAVFTNTVCAVASNAALLSLTGIAGPSTRRTDFNGDGKPDLLWRNAWTGENLIWYLNNATYVGYTRLSAVQDTNWKSVATEDFNGDGWPDIFWRNTATGQNIVWFMNGATYVGYTWVDAVPIAWLLAGAADFNSDGRADLLWRNASTGENIVWYMNGTSYAGSARVNPVADTRWRIAGIADFNADGKPDLLWRHTVTGENLVWHMNGVTYAGYARIDTVADVAWSVAVVADFDGNGTPDLFWRNYRTGQNLIWYLNGTAYTGYRRVDQAAGIEWVILQGASAGSTGVTDAADFNRDGKPDILWWNASTGENIIWYMNNATYQGYARVTTVADTAWRRVATADFNADGKPDILWRNASTGGNIIWYMDGATNTGYTWIDAVPDPNWSVVGAADVNRDGASDILWRNTSTGQNIVWYMNNAAYAGYAWLDTVADTAWRIVGVGDFNGDGRPDLLWRHSSTGQNLAWYMTGASRTGSAYLPENADTNWQVAMVADFDGDAKVDILWRNGATGQNIVWYMNGVTYVSYRYVNGVADTNWKIGQQQ